MEEINDINISSKTTIKELIESFSRIGGFIAQEIYRAKEILEEMFSDKSCIKFLGFTADLVSTGLRGLLKEIIKRKMFDIVITTTGTLDHDIARDLSKYYVGSFDTDDLYLAEKGIHRLGNVFIPKDNYGIVIEKFMKELLKDLYDKGIRRISTYELCWEIGKRLGENSILHWSYRNRIPVIIPGIVDGCVGTQILLFKERYKDFEIDIWKDERFLAEISFEKRNLGALIVGGGISKHHIIWWAQFSEGLKYAVYVTTAVEYDGSLSGARTREAITWNKINKKAKHVTIWCEATVALPILLGYFL